MSMGSLNNKGDKRFKIATDVKIWRSMMKFCIQYAFNDFIQETKKKEKLTNVLCKPTRISIRIRISNVYDFFHACDEWLQLAREEKEKKMDRDRVILSTQFNSLSYL